MVRTILLVALAGLGLTYYAMGTTTKPTTNGCQCCPICIEQGCGACPGCARGNCPLCVDCVGCCSSK